MIAQLPIESEHESKDFALHGHDPKRCDVIVCWRHNWKECPAEIEVVESSKLFGQLAISQKSHRGDAETRRKAKIGRELTRRARIGNGSRAGK